MSVSASSSRSDVSSVGKGCLCPTDDEKSDVDLFPLLFRHLKRSIDDNSKYFGKYADKSVYKRFYEAFERIHEALEPIEDMAIYIAQRVAIFDYSPQAKGNGYRSLLRLLQHCIRALSELTYYCQSHRSRFYFRSHHYCLEIEAHADLFVRTKDLLNYAITCMNESKEGGLFPDSIDSRVMIEAEMMDRECFYGRTLGFQYRAGLRQFLLTVCVAMASFAEGYSRHKSSPFACMTTAVLHSGKYTVNPELRAKVVCKLTQKTNMEFCKAFWSLTEGFGLQHFPLFVCPTLKVNTLFHIPADAIELLTEGGESVHVAPPCSWSGLAPLQVRLLSYEAREGQIRDGGTHHNSSKVSPKSNGLILHIHGGGFVSQSSKSHEMYLRVWAKELNVPILSVDYSLAPEAPFPRALEECFFAYAWAVKNADKLGTTAEYFCVAGDSAGGNLSVAVCMRAAEYGIRRPNSLLTAYAPFNVQYVPSPSRLLSLMDPLLPTGILSACLGAYAGLGKSPFEEILKPPSNSQINRQTSSSMPVDINKTRPNSFLEKLKIGSRERRYGDGSPTTEGGLSLDTFHSCPTSPVHSSTSLSNSFHVKSPESYGNSPNHLAKGDNETLENHNHRHQHRQNSTTDIKRPASYHYQGDPEDDDEERFHSFTDDDSHSFNRGSHSDKRTYVDYHHHHHHDGHHASVDMETHRLSKLNLGHTEMQYTRGDDNDDECHIVNVIGSDGETVIFPVDDPCIRIGTPPLEENEQDLQEDDVKSARSMSQVSLPISKNPYMSPLLAPDKMLKTLPPIDIVACSLDPLLDDSIEFARRLRSLGKQVEFYILQDLPHGFLNFNLVCQEAKEGCDLCVACMKRTLMGKRKPENYDKPPIY